MMNVISPVPGRVLSVYIYAVRGGHMRDGKASAEQAPRFYQARYINGNPAGGSGQKAGNAAVRIRSPDDIYGILGRYAGKRQEHFIVITLNSAHEVIRARAVTKGLASKTVLHPRECFYPAIKDNAVAVIFAHNHPSGNVGPSGQDDGVTGMLRDAGELLGIPVLDHVIIGRRGFYSYAAEKRMGVPSGKACTA
jgi:DNA repair protein RadC